MPAQKFSLAGIWNVLQYRLHRHYLGGWTLRRWVVLALLAAPLLAISAGEGIVAALATVSFGLLAAIWLSRRQGYIHFHPNPTADFSTIVPRKLPFDEKVPIHLTGTLAVGGMERYFVCAAAEYQTFQTRERVLMAQFQRERWLVLFPSSAFEVGWWYAFFTPAQLKTVERGWLHFGRHPHTAIRLTVQPDDSSEPVTFLLSTDSPENMNRLLADIKADETGI